MAEPTPQLSEVDPYVWLYDVDLPTSPRTKLRATPYPESVAITFGRDEAGVAIPYYAMAITHSEIEASTDGRLPTINLTAQNITREAIALLEANDGLIGEAVRIRLVRLSNLPDGSPIIDEQFEVVRSNATESSVTLQLGQYSLYRAAFPARRITREYCVHRYGGAACGYDTTRVGSLTTCTKTYDGENGCIAHGDDEVAAGLTRDHPARFGGFRGVQRPSGIGVS